MSRLPFDEINALNNRLSVRKLDGLRARLKQHFDDDGHIKSRKDCEDIIDELLDLYLLELAESVNSINEQFSTRIQPDPQEVQEIVYRAVDGATWEDRVWTWFETGGTESDIMRIAETEAHRIRNEAAFHTAIDAGATEKTWVCMMLPTSRDTHIWLDGTTVPIDGYFYSYMGGKTLFPGQWGIAEEDVGCQCELRFN